MSRAKDFLKCLGNVTQHINHLQVDNLITNKSFANLEAPIRNVNTECDKIPFLPSAEIF
jgi:hypothetical protein